jgi:hypothetical protein
MKKIAWTFAAVAAVLLSQLYTLAAHAQAYQTYVSATGANSNTATNCQQTAPCLTINLALTVTSPGGQIVCLDTGFYTPFTISQSVTIDCHDRLVAPLPGGTEYNCASDGIAIDAPGGVVTLRNVNLAGFLGTDDPNCIGNGINIEAASKVIIEDCVIENFPQSDITATTSANTVLNIRNTTITNSVDGINLVPTGGALNGSIDHTMIAQMSGDGITTNTGSVFLTVTNSLIVNAAGIGVSSGGTGTVLEVDSSSVTNNNTAFATSGGLIRISRNVIYDNNTNYSISGGTIATSGNNNVAVNGSSAPNGTITQQ